MLVAENPAWETAAPYLARARLSIKKAGVLMVNRQQYSQDACPRGGAWAGGFRRRFAVILAGLMGLLVLVGQPASAASNNRARDAGFSADWSPEDCGIFKLGERDDEALCGYVSVPLRHGKADSPRIRLAVVLIPAADPINRKPDPLFLAQGGPGGSTIGGFAQVLLADQSKRPVLNRDLVLWDQRGTYFSQPRLQCRETTKLPANAKPEQEREALRQCGKRLQAEAGDLSAFNSLENARDADAIRAALGYERFNFYGVSYGTELGQFLMRERPQNLRAVILDAVVPLGFSLVTDVPVVKQRVMQQFSSACRESESCNLAYPGLGDRYLALLDKLDKSPVALPAPGALLLGKSRPASAPASPPAEADTMSGRDLDGALYQSIYSREAIPLVPYIIERAEQGDYSFAINFVQLMQASQSDMADGMYMAVVCSEYGDTPDVALKFPGVIKRLADEAAEDGKQILEVCRDWGIKLLDKSLLEPVRSDIPTLLISGRFDPITPPAHAQRVATTLSRAQSVTFARGAHGQAFLLPCANRLISDFLDNPDAKQQAACANEAAPVFFTPDQLVSLPGRRGNASASASIQQHLVALAGPAAVVAFALLLLFSAIPVYSVTEIVRVFRARTWQPPQGWAGRLLAAAPWIPVLAGITLLGFLLFSLRQLAGEIGRNQFLLLVGALPMGVKSLTWWLLPYAASMLLMTLAMVQIWRHQARSKLGRLYYTLLVVAGWAVCLALVRTGLFGW
jgi:pimeloyl-ACP methyl ester carboxylesterase